MKKMSLRTIICAYAVSFATSALAVGQASFIDFKDNHGCTDCSILHHAKETNKTFDSSDAKSLAETIGYTVLTDPEKQNDRYVMLGRKGGFYSELHVTPDRKIYVERMVDSNDPQWGSKIQR